VKGSMYRGESRTMSRTLKRVLHAAEELQAGVWRVVWCGNDQEKALQHCEVRPGRQLAIYDRDEETLRPGRCLWVVESQAWLLPWVVHGVYGTLLEARAGMREINNPYVGMRREVRLLRFVRRKQKKVK
jgi:hypothetical protein